jgi:hypothetical protein
MSDIDSGDIQTALLELLEEASEDSSSDFRELDRVRTFSDAGVMTRDAGLVLRLEDGTEYQLTIVRSH